MTRNLNAPEPDTPSLHGLKIIPLRDLRDAAA